MTPTDALRARVLAAAAKKPSPTRTRGRRITLAIIVASIAFALMVFELAGGFDHASGRPVGLTLGLAGGWLVACAALTWLAIGRGDSTLPRRPAVLVAAAIATPLACFVWMHVFNSMYEDPFARFGWRCLAYTLVIAALPLAGFLFVRRGIEPRNPAALGAAVGATCGAWGGLVMDMWCPLTSTPHVLVGHVAPLAFLALTGAIVGHRVLGLRRIE
jgi:hypothetical protein